MPPNDRSARRAGTSLRAKLALVAGSLCFCLLATELVARVVVEFEQGQIRYETWAPCARWDPDYGWSQRSGANVRVADGTTDYVVRVNRAGFRGREHDLRKPAGVRRVVLIGDSMSWGWGVAEHERFSDLLDERLGDAVEVVNLACPGYGTDQELRVLEEHAIAYEPDVVLLGFVWNDIVDASRKLRYSMWKPVWRRAQDGAWVLTNHPAPAPHGRLERTWREIVRWLTSRSALVQWIEAGRRPPAAPAELAPEAVLANLDARDLGQVAIARIVERGARPTSLTSMLLERIAARCDAAGATLVAFALPHNHDIHLYNPRFTPPEGRGAPVADVAPSLLAQRLAEAGERIGFATVQIDRALYAAAREGVQLDCGDGHYNAAGNALVADTLAPVLRGLLSGE